MTAEEFNNKWEKYLSAGHYGMDIHIPEVIEYLDKEFETRLTKLPKFKYQQVKIKFGQARFYFDLDAEDETYDVFQIEQELETDINNILKRESC